MKERSIITAGNFFGHQFLKTVKVVGYNKSVFQHNDAHILQKDNIVEMDVRYTLQ